MGSKNSKENSKKDEKKSAKPADKQPKESVQQIVVKPRELTEADMKFFMEQSGLGIDEIKNIFDKFHKNNPDALLDRKEFIQLYSALREEDKKCLKKFQDMFLNALMQMEMAPLLSKSFLLHIR